jgi:hypothetical protein
VATKEKLPVELKGRVVPGWRELCNKTVAESSDAPETTRSNAPLPQQSFGMPGYPNMPMFFPPYMYPYPLQMQQTPQKSRGSGRNVSPDIETPVTTVTYPLISDWLKKLDANPTRNSDNVSYSAYADQLHENDIIRLDDITRFPCAELCQYGGMKAGVAARIIEWANIDKGKLDKKSRR